MAPRQRQPSHEEDLRSSSPTTSEPTKPLVQAIVPPRTRDAAADVARERHDFFNLVALVSCGRYWRKGIMTGAPRTPGRVACV